MCSYADSKLKQLQKSTDPLEKAFSVTAFGFERATSTQRGNQTGKSANKEVERSAWGGWREFFKSKMPILTGTYISSKKKWKAARQASLVSQTNGQNKSSGAKGIHLELKEAPELRNGLGGQRRREKVAATPPKPSPGSCFRRYWNKQHKLC